MTVDRAVFIFAGLVVVGLLVFFVIRDRRKAAGDNTIRIELGDGKAIYCKPGVSEAQARAVGESLKRIGYAETAGWIALLAREAETFELWLPSREGAGDDAPLCRSLEAVAIQVSQDALDEAPLVVRLCDDDWNSKKALRVVVGWGTLVDFGNDEEVFYQKGTTEAQARGVAESLKKQGYFGKGLRSVQIGADAGALRLSFVVREGTWEDVDACKEFAALGAGVSKDVFEGRPVTVHLSDADFTSRKTLPPR
jgi:hypothetical protein